MSELARFGSPFNWQSDYFHLSRRPEAVVVHDLTLESDGEEMAGVTISDANKIEIAKRLCQLGVTRLSVLGNSPTPTPADIRIAERIVDLGLSAKIGAFVKTQEEIETAARIGLWGVTILVWVNDALLPAGQTGADIMRKSQALTTFAREKGLHTCFMAMDATRTRPEFLSSVIEAVEPSSDEYTIADSLGVASPFGFRSLVEFVRERTEKPIQVHCHNHSSMAVANALGAVLGGATIVQTTINGLGEFAGLLPLEEVVVALSMHLDVSTGIRLQGLKSLSDFVVKATGVPVAFQKPAVGDRAFCVPETEEIQEALWELEKHGLLEQSLTYPPQLVGNRFHMSIGRKCNQYTVKYNLRKLGYSASPHTIGEIIEMVREAAGQGDGYWLMEEGEFLDLIRKKRLDLIPLSSAGDP
jgi:isopropylmalate/homocitrate/citramalate synthase